VNRCLHQHPQRSQFVPMLLALSLLHCKVYKFNISVEVKMTGPALLDLNLDTRNMMRMNIQLVILVPVST
jgi:hypothetical protein